MIEVALKNPGESGGLSTRKLTYIVIGTTDMAGPTDGTMTGAQILQAVCGGETPIAPTSIDDAMGDVLYASDANLGDIHYSPGRTIGFVDVDYGIPEDAGPLTGGSVPGGVEATYEFSYQAASYHIQYALATRRYSRPYPALPAPNFETRLNVTKDGNDKITNGMDLPGGNTTNIWRLNISQGFMTEEYEAYIESIMGTVNSVEFKGRPAHTMRLVQCQSSITMDGQLSISWGFQFSKNRYGITVAGITGVDIYGHEYFWIYDDKVTNLATGETTLYARGVYVNQIHEESDWADIGF